MNPFVYAPVMLYRFASTYLHVGLLDEEESRVVWVSRG